MSKAITIEYAKYFYTYLVFSLSVPPQVLYIALSRSNYNRQDELQIELSKKSNEHLLHTITVC